MVELCAIRIIWCVNRFQTISRSRKISIFFFVRKTCMRDWHAPSLSLLTFNVRLMWRLHGYWALFQWWRWKNAFSSIFFTHYTNLTHWDARSLNFSSNVQNLHSALSGKDIACKHITLAMLATSFFLWTFFTQTLFTQVNVYPEFSLLTFRKLSELG